MLTRMLAVLRKETREILRDPYTLGIALVLPVIMLFLFAHGVNTDVRNIKLVVLDFDRTAASRDYAQAFVSSGYFRATGAVENYDQIAAALGGNTADAALVIPPGFGKALSAGQAAEAQTLLDGSYPPFAQVAMSYVNAINAAYNGRLLSSFIEARTGRPIDPSGELTVAVRVLYNPSLQSVKSIVTALFGVILMAFPPMLSALAIVREKERGSIQQVFVSPIRPLELVLGKLIPYGVIAFIEMLLVLAGGVFWFGVPFRGNLGLFLAAALLFVLTTVGIGLLVSTLARTQVAAMLLAIVLTIMPSMLFSGFLFPVHTMPSAMQAYASAFPARYFIDISRAILLKGQGLQTVGPAMLFLALYGAGLVLIASLRFKKRIG